MLDPSGGYKAVRIEAVGFCIGRVLLRASGTEPVLRVMAEAGTDKEAEENVDLIIAAMAQSGHLVEVRKK